MTPTLENFPSIYIGLYRVKISKLSDGHETIPAAYNEKTTLGIEVAEDVPTALRCSISTSRASKGHPSRLTCRA